MFSINQNIQDCFLSMAHLIHIQPSNPQWLTIAFRQKPRSFTLPQPVSLSMAYPHLTSFGFQAPLSSSPQCSLSGTTAQHFTHAVSYYCPPYLICHLPLGNFYLYFRTQCILFPPESLPWLIMSARNWLRKHSILTKIKHSLITF